MVVESAELAAVPFAAAFSVVVVCGIVSMDQKSSEKKRAFLAEIVEKCEPIGCREPLAFWESPQAGFICPPDSEGKKSVETWGNVTGQLAKVLAAKIEENNYNGCLIGHIAL